MKYFTYCLYSDQHLRLYIGHTYNLEKRILQHNSGRVISTKPYKPFRLIYKEEFNTKDEAVKREKELKGSNMRRFLRSLIYKI